MAAAEDIKSTIDYSFKPYVSCYDEDFIFQLIEQCTKKARAYVSSENIVVKVFEVGIQSNQIVYLNLAKEYIKDNHRRLFDKLAFETINNQTIKNNDWSPNDVKKWLMNSDIHIVLTHVHQGLISSRYDWDIYSIENNLSELKYHRGFPNGIYLKCSIFLQDKWDYLVAVKERVLPTLKVPLAAQLDEPSVIEKISKSVLLLQLLEFALLRIIYF